MPGEERGKGGRGVCLRVGQGGMVDSCRPMIKVGH